jgi:hypothetical protein
LLALVVCFVASVELSAQDFAYFATDAYNSANVVRKEIDRTKIPAGFRFKEEFSSEGKLHSAHANIYVNDDSKQVVIAYRGTQKGKFVQDWLGTNLNIFKKKNPYGEGKVARGFLKDVEKLKGAMEPELKDYLKQGYKVSLTGHSQGGAEAIIAAQWINKMTKGKNKVDVVTFGAPASGNKSFAKKYPSTINVKRYEAESDVIPKVARFVGLKHVGSQQRIPCSAKGAVACHKVYYQNMELFAKNGAPPKRPGIKQRALQFLKKNLTKSAIYKSKVVKKFFKKTVSKFAAKIRRF